MAGRRVVARIGFQYGDLVLDRGEVFELRNKPNDDKLLNNGYVAALENRETTKCGTCGREFIGYGELAKHGDRNHRLLSPEEQEQMDEREQSRMEREQREGTLHLGAPDPSLVV